MGQTTSFNPTQYVVVGEARRQGEFNPMLTTEDQEEALNFAEQAARETGSKVGIYTLIAVARTPVEIRIV